MPYVLECRYELKFDVSRIPEWSLKAILIEVCGQPEVLGIRF